MKGEIIEQMNNHEWYNQSYSLGKWTWNAIFIWTLSGDSLPLVGSKGKKLQSWREKGKEDKNDFS